MTKTEKKKVKKGGKEIEKLSPNDIRKEWGINIGENFIEVTAKCIDFPSLEFGNSNEKIQLRNGRFRQQRDYHPVNFNKENCVLVAFEDLVNLAREDCNQMKTAGKNLGVNFDFPQLEKLQDSKNKDALVDQLKRIDYNAGRIMAIVILDKKTKHLYPTIKDYIYTQGGIPSQFMLHDENPRGGRKK